MQRCAARSAFTLIELLIVIAVIAVLSIVVVLVLQPSQLLAQSRDSNRLSDMASLNTALGLYAAQGGTAFGNANTVYVSIPDALATTTAGDQCQGLGLAALPASDTYQCEPSSTFRTVSGQGWLPVNFFGLSGAPFAVLPIDPLNATSSGNDYTYTTGGNQYIVTAIPESQKYRTQYDADPSISDYPGVIAEGSNLTISPLWSATGLMGYWPFEEGSGSSTSDSSGDGNTGTWSGASIGGSHYTTGKIGNYAGNFDGSTDAVSIPTAASISFAGPISMAAWVYPTVSNVYQTIFVKGTSNYGFLLDAGGTSKIFYYMGGTSGSVTVSPGWSTNAWNAVVVTADGTNVKIYINGVLANTTANTATATITAQSLYIGEDGAANRYYTNGSIDDARIYDRALSAAEVQALYNAQK